MRRNARSNHHADDSTISAFTYQPLILHEPIETEDLQMERLSTRASNNNTHRFENTIEAKVESGDTLQAIALRFQCTVADIKRLNKIDKDNEIHARKVVKIPVTIHNVLLDTLPTVHKSGNNSPKPFQKSGDSNSCLSSIVRNPHAETMLNEKLMVALVNSSWSVQPTTSEAAAAIEGEINNILNSKRSSSGVNVYTDDDLSSSNLNDESAQLITDSLDDSTNMPNMHRIRGPSLRAMDWSGSDCDMSWVCLFVVILALCFVIPLVYVFYIAERSHHNTTSTTTLHH